MNDRPLVKQVEDYLLENQHQSGIKLENELDLANRFQVSRNSLREVMMHFQFLGVIERTKNKGSYVKQLAFTKLEEVVSFCFQLSGFNFDELKEARLQLELAILPLIIRRATPVNIATLNNNIELMIQLKGDADRADRLDKEFHLLLFDICGNRPLKVFANILTPLFRKPHRERFLNPTAVLKSAADHKLLVEAIETENLARAQDIIKRHITPT